MWFSCFVSYANLLIKCFHFENHNLIHKHKDEMKFLKVLVCLVIAAISFGQTTVEEADTDVDMDEVSISENGVIVAASRKMCSTVNNIRGGGCHRYVRGFDITGATNESNQGQMASPCDCLAACIASSDTCSAWVWKYTSSGQSDRSCILYSNFNLPPSVVLEYDTGASQNQGTISNNPQHGGYLAKCTTDGSRSGTHDKLCISGVLWPLRSGRYFC